MKFQLFSAAENKIDDPLCKLKDHERLRLCGLIFNSEYFDGKVEYPSEYTVVRNFDCEKKEVSFRSAGVKAQAREEPYHEWMILCYMSYMPYGMKNVEMNIENVYFVSRAYNNSNNALSSNDVFVYHHEPDGIFLVNAFTKIRLRIQDRSERDKISTKLVA